MNNLFSKEEVLDLFYILNGKVDYLLLRNIDNELPSKLSRTKDIDIIVKETSSKQLNDLLLKNGWNIIPHPSSRTPFLYGMKPFKFYNKKGLHLDVCYQLPCRSLNKREWFPLHMDLQDDVWNNTIHIKEPLETYMLSYENEFVHLLTRCLLDKRQFNEGYINRINYLYSKININLVREKLLLIFYKYTDVLLEKIKNKQYENLPIHYLQFKDY